MELLEDRADHKSCVDHKGGCAEHEDCAGHEDRVEHIGPPPGASLADVGDWLATTQRAHDRWRAAWLLALAAFDDDQGWALDGQLSCVEWLCHRAGMSRATAFEKLRVARELARRPVVAAAFAAGRVSYSAARILTRAVGAQAGVDEALVDLAEAAPLRDVEHAVRAYQRYAAQETPPPDPVARRGLRLIPQGDGTTRIEGVLTDLEAAELSAALDAIEGRPDHLTTPPESPVETPEGPAHPDGDGASAPESAPTATQCRADALMALARTARIEQDAVPSGDRYMVHVVVDHGEGCILGGEPLDAATTAEVLCDCSTVIHHHSAAGEPLALGRRTRTWTTAQRRAVAVRDGGRCRWPGCHRRRADVHHMVPWEDDGPTDTDNGILLCPRHHTLVHRGFRLLGAASGRLLFHRPDGEPVGASWPARR